MTAMTIDPTVRTVAPSRRTEDRGRRCRLLAPFAALAALVLLIVFVALGVTRMVDVTSAAVGTASASGSMASGSTASGSTASGSTASAGLDQRTAAPTTSKVASGYEASLWPLGFTVHWSDGSDETHLWW